jgi:hypothetical protein
MMALIRFSLPPLSSLLSADFFPLNMLGMFCSFFFVAGHRNCNLHFSVNLDTVLKTRAIKHNLICSVECQARFDFKIGENYSDDNLES